MELEYYTISQAARALDSHTDDIEHLLVTGKIPGFLYSFKDKFLILEKTGNEYIGRGFCEYSGLIYPNQNCILELINKKKKIEINSSLLLCMPSNITQWWPNHNFDENFFFPRFSISYWSPWKMENAKARVSLLAIPLPKEGPGGMHMFVQAIESMAEKNNLKRKPTLKSQDYPEITYSFYHDGEFKTEDIRIRHNELKGLLTSGKDYAEDNKEPEKPGDLVIQLTGERRDQLNELLIKTIIDRPALSTKERWDLLKSELEAPEGRKYDSENILTQVTDDAIYWRSENFNDRTLALSSFSAKISKLKKKILHK